MEISVVIPAWNEEFYLPGLLSTLRTNSHMIHEIIVADNNSRDATREVADRFGCRVVPGGNPATGRNSGAGAAKGEIMLFLDADAIIESEMFDRIVAAFSDFDVIGYHPILVPTTDDGFIRCCYRVADLYFRIARSLGVLQGLGSIIAVRRSAFASIGGFNESLSVGEDVDFFRRLGHVGKIVYDINMRSYVSARRFYVENRFVFASKCLVWAILRFFGSLRCPWGYRWIRYPLHVFERDIAFLTDVKTQKAKHVRRVALRN